MRAAVILLTLCFIATTYAATSVALTTAVYAAGTNCTGTHTTTSGTLGSTCTLSPAAGPGRYQYTTATACTAGTTTSLEIFTCGSDTCAADTCSSVQLPIGTCTSLGPNGATEQYLYTCTPPNTSTSGASYLAPVGVLIASVAALLF